jgi:hypothetical protein
MGGDLAQIVEQQVGIMRHRLHLDAAEGVGHQPHRHLAVFQHVGHAGRHAQVVFQHIEFARAGAHDVHAGDVAVDVLGHVHVLHLGAVLGVEEHLFGGHHAGAHDVVPVVDIVDEHIQRAHALLQARLQVAPFVGGNDPRDQVEGNQALGAGGVARDRESDADPAEAQVRLQPAHGHGFRGLLAVPALEGLVMGAYAAGAVAHFVIGGGTGCSVLHGSSGTGACGRLCARP